MPPTMIEQRITPFIWLQCDHVTRQKLANQFGLRRSGGPVAVTQNGITTIESDGYSVYDLKPLSVEAMQEFTGSKVEDIGKLFQKTIDKLNKPATHENV